MFYQAKSDPGAVSSGEKRRIVFLLIALGFLAWWVFSSLLSLPDPDAPDSATEAPPEAGGPVNVSFERARLMLEDGETADTVKHKIEAEEAATSSAPETPEPDPIAPFVENRDVLATVEDRKVDVIEDDAYYYLLHQVASLSDDEIAKLADGKIGFDQLKADPAAYRGKFVTVRGRLLNSWQEVTNRWPNKANAPWIWMFTLLDGNKPIRVAVLDKEREYVVGSQGGEPVEVTGAFFKVHAYLSESEENTQPFEMPFIIARRVRPIRGPTFIESYPYGTAYTAVGAIALTALVLAIALWRGKKASAELDRQLLEKRKARFLKGKGATSGRNPSGPDPGAPGGTDAPATGSGTGTATETSTATATATETATATATGTETSDAKPDAAPSETAPDAAPTTEPTGETKPTGDEAQGA